MSGILDIIWGGRRPERGMRPYTCIIKPAAGTTLSVKALGHRIPPALEQKPFHATAPFDGTWRVEITATDELEARKVCDSLMAELRTRQRYFRATVNMQTNEVASLEEIDGLTEQEGLFAETELFFVRVCQFKADSPEQATQIMLRELVRQRKGAPIEPKITFANERASE